MDSITQRQRCRSIVCSQKTGRKGPDAVRSSPCSRNYKTGGIRGTTQKKTRLTLWLGKQDWVGRDRQTAIECVLTCHSVTSLSSIALLSTSGSIFKYRRVILGRKMSECKSERVNIKFLVKLKKSAKETFKLLTEAYGEDCMSHACMFKWQNNFRKVEKA